MSYKAEYIDHKGLKRTKFITANSYKEAEEKVMSMDGIYIMEKVEKVK